MGWRFRKSFSPLPGVRLTFSPRGVTTSVGVGPLRLTHGARGLAATTNLFGSGLSYRHEFAKPGSGGSVPSKPQAFAPDLPPLVLPVEAPGMTEIESAGTGMLTTSGLEEYRRLLLQARDENEKIIEELRSAHSQERSRNQEYAAWRDGWIKRRLFKQRFAQLGALRDEAQERREELEEQEKLSRLQTTIDLPDAVRQAYSRMSDAFSQMAGSKKIWDTTSERKANQVAERTSASRVIAREAVRFSLGHCELIESEWHVPHLENANGGDMYLYPGFILYFITGQAFALLGVEEFRIEYSQANFLEEETRPEDAKQIGSTWAKVNKDGSPDRRFRDNYQIPVMGYGKLRLTSSTGLNEEYMVSNASVAQNFVETWGKFAQSMKAA